VEYRQKTSGEIAQKLLPNGAKSCLVFSVILARQLLHNHRARLCYGGKNPAAASVRFDRAARELMRLLTYMSVDPVWI